MAENEEKGFVVKDRRKVSLDDAAPEPAAESIQEPPAADADKA